MVPRRRPLIRQKRRPCSRMGATSHRVNGQSSLTPIATVESKPRGEGGAVPVAIKPSHRRRSTASKREFDRRNPIRTLLRGAGEASWPPGFV